MAPASAEPGAHGSLWQTDLVVANISTTPLQVIGYVSSSLCPGLCPGPPPIPPKVSVVINEVVRCETRGTYLFVEPGRAGDLVAALRSQDASRQLTTWGTSVPVVRAADLFSGVFGINHIPMESQFRSTLRVYSVDPTAGAVLLRFYETLSEPPRRWPTFPNSDPDPLLLEVQTGLIRPKAGGGTDTCPSMVEIPLDQYPQLASKSRVRVEIVPSDIKTAYWAFVSTTHNSTQHVTVLTP